MMEIAPVMRSGLSNTGRKGAPPLKTIYFFLTEGCNLRCRHCLADSKFRERRRDFPVLDVNLFESILSQGKPLGLSVAKFIGGEPLLHPEMDRILELICEEGISLNLSTNGVLCTDRLARRIAACREPFVSVSLDGADAQAHEWVRGVEGAFNKAIRGIRNLVTAGIRPQLVMTLMRRTAAHVEDVVRLAESLDAVSVKLNIVQPVGRGRKMHEAGETLTIEELVKLGDWVENTLSKRVRIPVFFTSPSAFHPMGKMFGPDASCGICSVLNVLGVLPDGTYALCGIGATVPELAFGDAAKDSLSDVWNHTAVLKELREGLPRRLEGICGDCIMKGICLGSCIAQNYCREKNLWAGYWFCEQAKAQGLFPESRIQSGLGRRQAEIARPGTVAGGAIA